ncbi:hypothetical protein K0504_03625 [Neiella marina]|uniref:Uncharacterized protein n=1 Tax=Neiella holothuriorum TaxID=2870530 RepID=A0ABS7ED04_9GAMM|nr:hypothetical protein [Neiella holothuriorum]MBW8190115.1 hypothetical protein [Neiella holothuriorum]
MTMLQYVLIFFIALYCLPTSASSVSQQLRQQYIQQASDKSKQGKWHQVLLVYPQSTRLSQEQNVYIDIGLYQLHGVASQLAAPQPALCTLTRPQALALIPSEPR